ncbi:MAG: MBL fold metallo-hydrolase [Armatimonadetes bacterium]|nr:MBL fold metallo-hydrolase [Armatimonadota bacterium]
MPIREFLQTRREIALLSLASIVAVGIWIWALWPRAPVLSVTFLSVGQGDAAVIRTPGGHTALVDCGPGGSENGAGFDAGSKVIVPHLRRLGVSLIDVLVLTHPHEDHIGGAASVMDNFEIGRVLDSGVAHTSGIYRKLLERIHDRSIPYHRVWRGFTIDFRDGVKVEVLNPPRRNRAPKGDSEINDCSIVLRVAYRGVSFLLTGDAERDAENDMMSACPDLSSDVLKVAHHGGATATTTEWIAAARPRLAVISVGWKNPFGHPSDETLKRLKDAGVEIYRTDRCGGITITTDGRRISTSTARAVLPE